MSSLSLLTVFIRHEGIILHDYDSHECIILYVLSTWAIFLTTSIIILYISINQEHCIAYLLASNVIILHILSTWILLHDYDSQECIILYVLSIWAIFLTTSIIILYISINQEHCIVYLLASNVIILHILSTGSNVLLIFKNI